MTYIPSNIRPPSPLMIANALRLTGTNRDHITDAVTSTALLALNHGDWFAASGYIRLAQRLRNGETMQ